MEFVTRSGIVVQVDDDRTDLAELRGWYRHSSGYIAREIRVGGVRKLEFLHHRVLGTLPRKGWRVDHRNRDVFDNHRDNLRVLTPSQNAQNRNPIKANGLPRGVTWKPDQGANGKWCARATIDYKTHHIGYFETAEAAGIAVVAWRREHMTHSDEEAV